MKKVVKFGGSSLADARQFEKVGEIIKSDPNRSYVVPSAPGKRFEGDTKVTDMLLEAYRIAAEGSDPHRQLMAIKDRYQEIIDQLNLSIRLDEDFDQIEESLKEEPSLDFAASRGEQLNGKLMANYLGYRFIEPAENIFFDQDGFLDMNKTERVLGKSLAGVEKAIIPGF